MAAEQMNLLLIMDCFTYQHQIPQAVTLGILYPTQMSKFPNQKETEPQVNPAHSTQKPDRPDQKD